MKLKRAVVAGALLLVAGVGSGCSGINASGSVSPATFLLPGLIQAAPPASPGHDLAPAVALAARTARFD